MTTATTFSRTVTALLLLLLLPLAGCGGSAGDASESSGGSVAGSVAEDSGSPDSSSPAGTPGSGAVDAATSKTAVSPLPRAVISTGEITVHSATPEKARAEVLRLATAQGGSVADEQSTSDRRGRLVESTLTLRVPTQLFSRAMDALARVGKVEQQSRTSKDVTTKVLDNDARVRAGERAVRQVELLLGRAEKLSDIIAIESDLARRQADLDSLKSQQAWLGDQTSLSTIAVYLSRTTTTAPAVHETRGFLTGLRHGWNALESGALLVLTATGALLPFAALLGLLALPLWIGLRRRASAASAPARSA